MLIEEYFSEVESLITNCPLIHDYELHLDKRSFYIGIIEGRASFLNEMILHFIEFVNVKEGIEKYKYSYHLQDKEGKLVFRYDIAPHHKEIKTFPQHKHMALGKIIESPAPGLLDILHEIEDFIE